MTVSSYFFIKHGLYEISFLDTSKRVYLLFNEYYSFNEKKAYHWHYSQLVQTMHRQRQKATYSSSLCQIYGRNNVSNDSIIFIYLKTTLNAKQMFEALLMLSYNCLHSKTDVTLIGLFVTYAKWLLSINGTDNTVSL